MPLQINSETLVPATSVAETTTNFANVVNEGSTASYVLALALVGGGVLNNTALISAKLTLYDEETKSIINGRSAQDILGAPANGGANNVVISAASQFTWSLQGSDNAYLDPTHTKRVEYHRAIFDITFNPGTGVERLLHDIHFPVKRAFSPGE